MLCHSVPYVWPGFLAPKYTTLHLLMLKVMLHADAHSVTLSRHSSGL
jgi:hypothetical protein